jgi:chromosome segregation ATPase
LKVNNDEAEHKVKSIERQLKCEITVHLETKDEIAFLQAKVEELESQLLEKITNLDAIREEHLDYKRQLEFSAEEIANLDGEAQEISKEKINLENQLAATHNPPSKQENVRNFFEIITMISYC